MPNILCECGESYLVFKTANFDGQFYRCPECKKEYLLNGLIEPNNFMEEIKEKENG